MVVCMFFFFSSRRRHTRCSRDWSSDVCSSDLVRPPGESAETPSGIPADQATEPSHFPGGDGNWHHHQVKASCGSHQQKRDRKSTRLNSSHGYISYAVFCLTKKKKHIDQIATSA